MLCSKCELMLFCRQCIEKWQEQNENCPQCQQICAPKKINRWSSNILMDQTVICTNENCIEESNPMSYEKLLIHIENCPVKSLECPLNCGTEITVETHGFHLQECTKKLFECSCKELISKETEACHKQECPDEPIDCYQCSTQI